MNLHARTTRIPLRSPSRAGWSVLGLLALCLGGCAKSPPVPVDNFYRLPPPVAVTLSTLADKALPAWGEVVVVASIRANGLHTERAVVYSEDPGALTLRRYHYHHWVDGPPRLFREYLIGRLRASLPGSLVLDEYDGRADLVVSGRIKQFEHHVPEGTSPGQVLVAAELRATTGRAARVLLVKDYRTTVSVAGAGMGAAITAFGDAAAELSAQFARDVNKAWNSTNSTLSPASK